MNGRIYDPLIGRFMSADPIIQEPYNLKTFNRYSYGWNNPFQGSDPSGYYFEGNGNGGSTEYAGPANPSNPNQSETPGFSNTLDGGAGYTVSIGLAATIFGADYQTSAPPSLGNQFGSLTAGTGQSVSVSVTFNFDTKQLSIDFALSSLTGYGLFAGVGVQLNAGYSVSALSEPAAGLAPPSKSVGYEAAVGYGPLQAGYSVQQAVDKSSGSTAAATTGTSPRGGAGIGAYVAESETTTVSFAGNARSIQAGLSVASPSVAIALAGSQSLANLLAEKLDGLRDGIRQGLDQIFGR